MATIKHLSQSARILYHSYDSSMTSKGFQFLRYFTTSTILMKQTPHTVGVMSWVRAARRRKFLEQQMRDFEKSKHEIMREEQLARTAPSIEFRLPAKKIHKIEEDGMKELHIKPEVFLSQDRKTIICYHPPPRNYPESFTKRCIDVKIFGVDEDVIKTFRDEITAEDIIEGLKLKNQNSRTWNTDSLAVLFKVKPEVVEANIPLTEDQKAMENAERDLCSKMSVTSKKDFRDLQNWERYKYTRKTRGKEHANFLKDVMTKRKKRTHLPPKY